MKPIGYLLVNQNFAMILLFWKEMRIVLSLLLPVAKTDSLSDFKGVNWIFYYFAPTNIVKLTIIGIIKEYSSVSVESTYF